MIFVDTGVFYARLDKNDRHHAAADVFFAEVEEPLVTTREVVFETQAMLLKASRVSRSPTPLPSTCTSVSTGGSSCCLSLALARRTLHLGLGFATSKKSKRCEIARESVPAPIALLRRTATRTPPNDGQIGDWPGGGKTSKLWPLKFLGILG
jgi:hypothetical protein